MKNVSSIIAGLGEVGKGLNEILSRKYTCSPLDIDMKPDIDRCGILNICFPYSDKFVGQVNDYVERYKPDLTIIHSTVPVGTTRQINGNKVHSPIRGKHPDMAKGIETYTKFIGYENLEEGVKAVWYFENVGLRCLPLKKYETTELAKILSLVRYGMNIVFTKDQKDLCDKLGLDYEDVVNHWERTLNFGQNAIGQSHLNRPILEPLESPIGGHCVIPVSEMAKIEFEKQGIDTIVIDSILRFCK